MSTAITNNGGKLVYLHVPARERVTSTLAAIERGTYPRADIPVYRSSRWDCDNAPWILSRWLTGAWSHPRTGAPGRLVGAALRRLNPAALRVLVESYLAAVEHADGRYSCYEVACCDGSTIIPDAQMPCGIYCKDPAAMAHDYLFDLHHGRSADSHGVHWAMDDANDVYRDILKADGRHGIAAIWRVGLELFAPRYWAAGMSRNGLAQE